MESGQKRVPQKSKESSELFWKVKKTRFCGQEKWFPITAPGIQPWWLSGLARRQIQVDGH